MAFPFKSPNHSKNRANSSHGSACSCGSCDSGAAALANNRNIGDGLQPRDFQRSLKSEIERSTAANEDKFLSNVDALAFSGIKTPSVVLESYILSNVIAKMEANTDFLLKGTDKALAGNCGKRVMSLKLQNKIYGTDLVDDFNNTKVNVMMYKDSIGYYGVMCCHNVWGCPVCARKLSERRKQGLSQLLEAHFEKFGADSVTASLFTVPHSKYDDLEDIRKRLLKAYSDMTRSRGYKQLLKTLESCGSSRAVEVTWSLVNGFHPHIHVLNFFEQNLLLNHQFISDTLFNLWADALKKNCFDAPNRQAFGCNLVPSTKAAISAVAEYFLKPESDVNDADIMGYLKKHKSVIRTAMSADGSKEISSWRTEHEMTKWHLKQARHDGENFRYSMFDFVRGYSIADDNNDQESKAQFRRLWLEYRKAFKGQRQLWTKHKHFKISELMMSDQELGEQELPEEKKTIASIDFKQWLVVVFMNARGMILEKARKKGSEGVAEGLAFINEAYFSFFPDDPCAFSSHFKNENPLFTG